MDKLNQDQTFKNLSDCLAIFIDEKIKRNIEALKNELHDEPSEEQLLTREETAKFFDIDLSTLYLWTKKGKIPSYGIGHRRYYKRSELLESLIKLKK